jgi:hypothetical protein
MHHRLQEDAGLRILSLYFNSTRLDLARVAIRLGPGVFCIRFDAVVAYTPTKSTLQSCLIAVQPHMDIFRSVFCSFALCSGQCETTLDFWITGPAHEPSTLQRPVQLLDPPHAIQAR